MAVVTARAFSPGTVGNIASGFDLLGHCIKGVGDYVTATRISKKGSQPTAWIRTIEGVTTDLPTASDCNTASRAASALLRATNAEFDIELDLEKGIALGSGLGGSAASATAALVASNALLPQPLSQDALYPYALIGEAIASDHAVGDNVGPQLIGGLVLATAQKLWRLPVPEGLTAVVVRPSVSINTKHARECLAAPFPMDQITQQQASLAQLLLGLYANDQSALASGLIDHLIEPRRASLIPGLAPFKAQAFRHGALGASISGAGPSVFAWFTTAQHARHALEDLQQVFVEIGLEVSSYVSPVDSPGACLIKPHNDKA